MHRSVRRLLCGLHFGLVYFALRNMLRKQGLRSFSKGLQSASAFKIVPFKIFLLLKILNNSPYEFYKRILVGSMFDQCGLHRQ